MMALKLMRIFLFFFMAYSSFFCDADSDKGSSFFEIPLSANFDEVLLSYKNCDYVDFYSLDVFPDNRVVLQYFCNILDSKKTKKTFIDLATKKEIEPIFPDDSDIDKYHEIEKKLGIRNAFFYEPSRHFDENPVVYIGAQALAVGEGEIDAQCGCLCKSSYYTLELRTIDGDVISRKVLLGIRPETVEVEGLAACATWGGSPPSDAPTYRSSVQRTAPIFWVTADGRVLIGGKANQGRLPVLFSIPANLETPKILFGNLAVFLDADIYAQQIKLHIENYNKRLNSDPFKGNKSSMEYAEAELRKAVLSGELDIKVNQKAKNTSPKIVSCPAIGDVQTATVLNRRGEAVYRENVDAAQALFEQAIQKDASLAKGYSNLALVYYKKNNVNEAKKAGELAIACGWRDTKLLASSLFNLGKLFEDQGDLKKAKYLYARAYENNQLQIYQNALDRLSGRGF